MNTTIVLLIITMGSSPAISYKGFGGVSVTTLPSMESCLLAKDKVRDQIRRTDVLEIDDNEILIECKPL